MSRRVSHVLGPAVVTTFFSFEHLQGLLYSSRSTTALIPPSAKNLFLPTKNWSPNHITFLLIESLAKAQQKAVMSFSALSSHQSMIQRPQRKEHSFVEISIATASQEEAVLLLGELSFERTSKNTEEYTKRKNNHGPSDEDVSFSNSSQWKSLPKDITVQGVLVPAVKELAVLDEDDCRNNNNNNNNNTFPKTIKLIRNGVGVRTLRVPFGWDVHVYVATLYTTSPVYSEEDFVEYLGRGKQGNKGQEQQQDGNHFVMEFTFLRAVTPSQMSIAWNYQLDTSVTHHHYEGYQDDRQTFLNMLEGGPMAEHGTIIFEFIEGKGLRIINQGNVVGTIPSKDFALAFASMFLGDKPVTTELKTGLLQGARPQPSTSTDEHVSGDNNHDGKAISVQA